MNTKKKYAIRKLAVGVASVSIGLFISNTPEVAQTLGSVGGGVIQAFDNGTETTSNETIKDWKPEGSVVAQGEDGVPWELYENGYLLFKPVPGKDTLTNNKGESTWKRNHGSEIKHVGFAGKVYAPEDSAALFSSYSVEHNDSVIGDDFYFKPTSFNTTNFDTSKVTNMSWMFSGLSNLKNLDVSHFDTSKVTNMQRMFNDIHNVAELNVTNFDTRNVIDMEGMFYNMHNLKHLDVTKFNTDQVTNMGAMFEHLYQLTELDVTNFDTRNVTNMSSMFAGLPKLTKLDVTHFNTSKVTDMSRMFDSMINLTELDVTNFDTRNVTSMMRMFAELYKLKSLDVTHFNTSNVTDMGAMFSRVHALTKLDVTNFDTRNVTNMEGMFNEMTNLTSLDVTKFDTHNVTKMSLMFSEMPNLVELDVSNFNTSQVTEMDGMFRGMSKMTKLDVSNFDTSNIFAKITYDMFEGMSKLKELKLGDKFLSENIKTIPIQYNDEYPNKWRKVDDYKHLYSVEDWANAYQTNPSKIAGTWVREVIKPTSVEKQIDLPIVEKQTDKLVKGKERITQGRPRIEREITEYTVNETTGDITETKRVEVVDEGTPTIKEIGIREPVNKIVNEQGKELTPEDLINYTEPNYDTPDGSTAEGNPIYKVQKITTTYKGDDTLDKGQQVVEKDGKTDGNKVVRVGTKPTVKVEQIPSPVRYEKDNSREKGQENITISGKDGSKTTTTTYTVNPKTGEVMENVGKPVVVEPTETVVKVAAKDKVSVEKLPSPVRYEKDNTREKGQENITVKGKDGSKTTTTTYTVNPKTGEVVENVGKPVVVDPAETVVKVATKDKVEVVNKKDGETVKVITSYEVNPKTEELKEVKREELLSKKGIPEVSEESTDFKGGINPTESIVREDLPELKVALIKDGDGNILEVIKEDEKPKDIQGYKNTGKTETDKDGRKVYIYEKVEDKQESPEDKKEETEKPKTEEKVVNKDKEDKKEVISKKEELPKTSASMLSTVGLFSIFGLRKNRRKDKK